MRAAVSAKNVFIDNDAAGCRCGEPFRHIRHHGFKINEPAMSPARFSLSRKVYYRFPA
jgi:hypothetical protein